MKSLNVVTSILYFPMLLFSGATIPFELFPRGMQTIANVMPYTLAQMADVHQITALKCAGFTLEDIKGINCGWDEKLFLQKKKSQLLSQIAELTHQVAIIDSYLCAKQNVLSTPVPVEKKMPE